MKHPLLPALLLAAGLAAQNRLLVPQQFAEIRDAIAAASPGDVIEVTTPTGRFQPIVIDRPLTIFGRAFEHTVPVVMSAGGPAIDVRVASGETVYWRRSTRSRPPRGRHRTPWCGCAADGWCSTTAA